MLFLQNVLGPIVEFHFPTFLVWPSILDSVLLTKQKLLPFMVRLPKAVAPVILHLKRS